MPKHLFADYLDKIEAFLNEHMALLPGSAIGIGKLLHEAKGEDGERLFPFHWQQLQLLPIVKQFAQAIKDADAVHIEEAADSLVDDVKPKGKPDYSWEESDTAAKCVFVADANRIVTLDDALKVSGADMDKWDVAKWKFNKWEMGFKERILETVTKEGKRKHKDTHVESGVQDLIQVCIDFKPKVIAPSETAIKGLIEEFKAYVSPVPRFTYSKQEECAAIINLYDAHIDKVCLVTETGYGSTIEDNVEEFERLFDRLLTHAASYAPELIIFPIGHDFFNTNGPMNTTKRGTPQDTAVKSHDSFKVGVKLLRRCIDKARHVARVKVKVIKGNHDEDKDFYLGQVLEAIYETDQNTEIDTDRKQRKYEEYGLNLFGFGHGDKEARKVAQLPLMMAEEEKAAWARTIFRSFFLGDKHHKMEYQFLRGKDFIGCLVKFLRSVGTSDEWHYDNGYIGIPRTGEVEIHSKTRGIIGHHFAHAQYSLTA
jgi:hypothetical protein